MTTPLPRGKLYEELEKLMNDTKDREEACREYLQHVKTFLFHERRVLHILHFDKEIRLMTGDVDFAISGRVSEAGVECERAYVWELKAPQCAVFTRETDGRLIPTKPLIEAENQLLHYFFEAQGHTDFRKAFKILDPNNIRAGGIIISCEKRKVAPNVKKEKRIELYANAFRTREKLYHETGMRLLLWDDILAQLRVPLIGEDGRNPNPKVLEASPIPPEAISEIGSSDS